MSSKKTVVKVKTVTKKVTKSTSKPTKATKSTTKASSKVVAKKAVKSSKVVNTPKKTPVILKGLDKIETLIKAARKTKQKEVVVLTTTRGHYVKNVGNGGFGADDLKTVYKNLYKTLWIKYDVRTKPVNLQNFEIAWVVPIK